LQRERLVVCRPFVRGRKLRNDVQLLVDVEQLVAERREYDAADERARKRGIEHIGIFGKTDAQRLRVRGERESGAEKECKCGAGGKNSHVQLLQVLVAARRRVAPATKIRTNQDSTC